MQLHLPQRELTLKVVYYGPGLSGKTTNLQVIHARTPPQFRGRLLTLETRDDRTLFFDLLPLFFESRSGFKVKVKVFTVPGQVLHNSTRRVVLQGADAIAFVADARKAALADNNAYWQNLHQNMMDNGLLPQEVPVVIQFNKRDLPGALDDGELEDVRLRGPESVFGAVAIREEGVLETFHGVLEQAYRALELRSELSAATGMGIGEFLTGIFSHMDLKGTDLSPLYGEQP